MEGLPNRKQRRQWAKDAGFVKKKQNASLKEKLEMSRRSMETGKAIHLANTERILREQDALKEKERSSKIESLIAKGYTQEEALQIIVEQEK